MKRPTAVGSTHDLLTNLIPSAQGLPGTSRIMSLRGEVLVSALEPGDRLVTRDRGAAVLQQIKRRCLTSDVVRIRAGSLGHNRPERDVVLPQKQQILLRGERARLLYGSSKVMVPVERLCDGVYVASEGMATLTVYDLILDSPHVLYVDGLELASFVQSADRADNPGSKA